MSTQPLRLIVLRHAKAAWPDGVSDFDRPLAPRGRRDAPAAGRRLREAGWIPDMVICSPARRTRETFELVAPELAPSPAVTYDPRAYEASGSQLLTVLRDVPSRCRTLLLVGHSPGVQDLTLALARGAAADEDLARARGKFPTSAIAVLALPGPWQLLAPASCLLVGFAVPRGHDDHGAHERT
ncbi:SixA phosphatase family protein [Streptomyces sp. NPDC058385]|uniref:SixA phosphatase family protein n=1 Tax=Streptomyces sp. NPDC058385 TaxID=3346473 RepID=UPI00366A2DFF